MSTPVAQSNETEFTILSRVLGNGQKKLSKELARYLLSVGFDEEDKARMHDLALRNQEDQLSADEKKLLLAFVEAGDMLSILKSQARRTLKVKPKRRKHP